MTQIRGVQVLAAATVLPESFRSRYAKLWTNDRMDRVIEAAKNGRVALEIDDRLHVPSPEFIKRAKAAGVRLVCGGGNEPQNAVSKLAYCFAMIQECGLIPNDLWFPEPQSSACAQEF